MRDHEPQLETSEEKSVSFSKFILYIFIDMEIIFNEIIDHQRI